MLLDESLAFTEITYHNGRRGHKDKVQFRSFIGWLYRHGHTSTNQHETLHRKRKFQTPSLSWLSKKKQKKKNDKKTREEKTSKETWESIS